MGSSKGNKMAPVIKYTPIKDLSTGWKIWAVLAFHLISFCRSLTSWKAEEFRGSKSIPWETTYLPRCKHLISVLFVLFISLANDYDSKSRFTNVC